jgi:hypothetical protein
VAQRHRLDAGPFQEPLDPSVNGKIEIDSAQIHQQGNLPDCDCTQKNGSAIAPAAIDQGSSG